MPTSNVKSLELETFRSELSKLIERRTIDDLSFADAVYTAQSKFGVDEDKFRNAFGLTKGAVDRWTQRQNLPQPLVRPKILKWIGENL